MLEFKNLCAGYDGVEKLHSINARLECGRLTAIIGPNGCGKSTLLKCATGLLKPSGGEILLDNRSLCTIPKRERAAFISYMPQSRVTPDISVKQLVAHGRYPHLKWGRNPSRTDREIVQAAIERVKLTKHAEKMVGCLSGGERQRAYIAMMLAQQTPVMLLDEPTTHLDLSSQFALMALLQDLCREGRCVAVVLHDLALALEYSDEILLMQRGNLLARGNPKSVYESGEMQNVFGVDIRQSDDQKYVFYSKAQEERA